MKIKKPTKTLIVDSLDNENLVRSSRNVQKTKIVSSYGLNIYDLLYHEKLLISKTAIEELSRMLDPKREKSDSDVAETEESKKVETKEVSEDQEAKKESKPKKEAKAKAEKTEETVAEEAKPAKKAKAKKAEKEETAETDDKEATE